MRGFFNLFGHVVSQDDLDMIRHGINGGWAVGAITFKETLAAKARQRVAPAPRGGAARLFMRAKNRLSGGDREK